MRSFTPSTQHACFSHASPTRLFFLATAVEPCSLPAHSRFCFHCQLLVMLAVMVIAWALQLSYRPYGIARFNRLVGAQARKARRDPWRRSGRMHASQGGRSGARHSYVTCLAILLPRAYEMGCPVPPHSVCVWFVMTPFWACEKLGRSAAPT